MKGSITSLPRFTTHALRVSFSTSTPRWPRARPGLSARPKRQQQPPSREPTERHHEIQQPHSKSHIPVVEEQQAQDRTPEVPSQRIVPRTTSQSQDAAIKPPSIPFQPKKRSAPPNLAPKRREFFLAEIIRQGPSPSSTLATEPSSPSEARRLALAAAFFDHPSRFLYSAAESLRHHVKNEHVPEILILGASNVGKSSFLNALVGKPDAARVSARPGKTTLMNAFGVGPPAKLARGLIPPGEKMPAHSLVVLDTPGYGYKSQASWGEAVVRYMGARKALRGAVLLLSSEKRISELDRWLLRALCESNTPTTVVLTKADKGGPSWRKTCGDLADSVRAEMAKIERTLGGRKWREGAGWNPHVYVTAAGLDKVPKLGNGGGVGGVRAAILEMAGFGLDEEEVKLRDEAVAYTGEVVSFDDIKWKT